MGWSAVGHVSNFLKDTMPKTTRTEPKQITLGNRVKDVTTKSEGLAMYKLEGFDGNVRIGILQEADKQFEIDAILLEYVDAGVAHLADEADVTDICIGHMVKDIVTGFKGIATTKMTSLNGCVFFMVQPKMSKKIRAQPKEVMISSKLLEIIGEGLVDKAIEAASNPTGGPRSEFKRLR